MATVKVAVSWQIRNLDSGALLNPPYPISEAGLRTGAGGAIAEQPRYGFQDPIIQWTSGKGRMLTFSTALFTEDSTEDIAGKMWDFEFLALKDPDLGRPPICIFTLGDFLAEMVMVEDVGQDIPPIRPDGKAREVRLDLTLKRYVPFSQTQIDPTKPKKESYFLIVSGAEASYEAISGSFYGDPLKGDRLRKRHPEMPLQPIVGAKISVPPRSTILSEEVTPEFHALDLDNEDAAANYEELLAARATRKAVLI